MAELEDLVRDLVAETREVRTILEMQTNIFLETLRQVTPAMRPKTYIVELEPFKPNKSLAEPHTDTKYFTVTNDSDFDIEVSFTKDQQSGQFDFIAANDSRRYDAIVPHLYARLSDEAGFGASARVIVVEWTYVEVSATMIRGFKERPLDPKERSKRERGTGFTSVSRDRPILEGKAPQRDATIGANPRIGQRSKRS